MILEAAMVVLVMVEILVMVLVVMVVVGDSEHKGDINSQDPKTPLHPLLQWDLELQVSIPSGASAGERGGCSHVSLVMLGRAAGLGQMGAAQDWSPCESQLTSCGTKGFSREGQCDDSGHRCSSRHPSPTLLLSSVERKKFTPLSGPAVPPEWSMYGESF